jgi:hypothetical protein
MSAVHSLKLKMALPPGRYSASSSCGAEEGQVAGLCRGDVGAGCADGDRNGT